MPITPPLRAHRELTIGPHHKSVPAGLWGRTIGSAVADSLRLGEFATPVLTIDSAVLESNLAAMGRWSAGTWISHPTARPPWPRRCGLGCSNTAPWR